MQNTADPWHTLVSETTNNRDASCIVAACSKLVFKLEFLATMQDDFLARSGRCHGDVNKHAILSTEQQRLNTILGN